MQANGVQTLEERAELQDLLQSGIFHRAPNLANFLTYVCERHFEGDLDSIKEYCIAVEALHRPADFDQKKDSIVRVEAHRLRKRLAEFYDGPGASHTIQIDIPNGQYAPRFIHRVPLAATNAVTSGVVIQDETPGPLTPPAVPPNPRISRNFKLILLAVAAILTTVFFIWKTGHAVASSPVETWSGSYAEPVPNEFRFIAGYHGSPFTDRQGRLWQPDSYFNGGVAVMFSDDIAVDGLPDPKFISSRREGAFHYSIPARPGTYELHLHFIGNKTGDSSDPASLSSFRVLVNNKPVLEGFDPISDAGAFYRFHSRVIRDVSPDKDGRILLAFQPITNQAFVSAVEVLSSEPGRVRPVRIVAAKSSVIDSEGAVWAADQDAIGGVLVERRDSIQDPRLKMLFAGEHYGNFAYHIPVPPGNYRVKLYFAETYFGSKLPAATTATGARLFNVFADGTALLRDFDVTKEAGGPNRAVVKTFDNIQPNAQGNIVFEFVPLRNYAEVNAIEVSQVN